MRLCMHHHLRIAFVGHALAHYLERTLTCFMQPRMTAKEIRASGIRHRSPLLLTCEEDGLCGNRYPLDMLIHYG